MFEIYFWILPLSYNSLIYIHGSWQNKMRLNINKKQVSIIQSTNINMNIYVTMLDGSNSCSWCSLKHWRRHSSLIFLVLLFTKPNIEVSGWLYQTKTHLTHIVYQPFSRVSPPSFTLYGLSNSRNTWIINWLID